MAFLDKAGLEQLWLNIVSKLGGKVDKVEGKGLSTNDYTTREKEQLVTLTGLVGDTAVSTQISKAVSSITPESIGALKEEDYYGIIREEGEIVSAESLDGLAIGTITDINAVQAGSGDPSPDNIRAITGWDTATLTRTAENLFGGNVLADTLVSEADAVKDTEAGTVNFKASIVGGKILFDKFKENTQYTFIFYGMNNTNDRAELNLNIIYADNTNAGSLAFQTANENTYFIYTTPAGKTVKSLTGSFRIGSTTLYYDKCGVFEGVLAADDLKEYKGQTLTAELPETVYGGSLDWNTGVLTVTHRKLVIDGETVATKKVSRHTNNVYYATYMFDKAQNGVISTNKQDGIISSHYIEKPFVEAGNCYITGAYGDVLVIVPHNQTLTTVELLNTYYQTNPVTFVYKLATPYTIQLTPQQLTAINGVNCVWSNCGDVCVTFNYTPFLETVNNMLVNNGNEGQSLTLDSNKKLIWENAPWKNILDPSGDMSFRLYASEGKSIIDSMKTMPLGLYTIYVQEGCPDNPLGAEAINSSLRGIMNINTNPTEQCYGWIILFDDESHCYIQYVQSGVGSGWTQLDQKIDPTLSIEGAPADAKVVGDAIAALNEHYGIIHKEGNIVVEESLEGLAIGAISDIKPTQAGTGDPTPDNIRPITGQNVAHIYRTGKNLSELGTITVGRSKQAHLSVPIPPGTYTMSAIITSNDTDSTYCNVHFYSGNTAHVKRLFSRSENGERIVQPPITFTKDITSIYFYASDGYANGTGDVATFADIQIEQNSVATEYEVYNGQKLTSTLPETIYGGTLDWATGLLTVTHRCLTLDGTENWNSNSSTNPGQFYMTLNDYSGNVRQGSYCSHYLIGDAYNPAIDKHIEVRDTFLWLYDTTVGSIVADLKTYLAAQAAAGTPVTLVYQLTTPYTIQLAPQQLTAINGDNYVWSDYGDIRANFNYTPFSGLINTKVDKIEGMGLSANDYTTTEKNKLAGIETGANKTIIDSELSSTSTNPVQNKIINTAINNLKSLVGDTAVSSQIAGAIADLINGAPTTLDTLGEIAAAMEENADVVAALDAAIGTKANISDLTSHINNKTNPHKVTLDQLGVAATIAELNHMSGVTSNVQAQFNKLSVAITDAEIDAICGATLEFDDLLVDESANVMYKLYVSNGDLKMTEVTEE